MDNFHRIIVAGIAVTATHASAILTVNIEVVVHAGMDEFHRRLVAGIAGTATHASATLTVNREVVVYAGMKYFYRRLIADVAITATHASAILNVNRDKKREISQAVISKYKKREISLTVSSKDRMCEISLSVISKDSKYRSDRMESRIVADTISKEKTTQQVSFADEQVDTMKDVNIPRTFLSENRHSSTTEEDLSEIWGLSIPQAELTLKLTTQKLNKSTIMPLTQR